jgi:hypothetical protein
MLRFESGNVLWWNQSSGLTVSHVRYEFTFYYFQLRIKLAP